jgi:transposase
MASEILLADKAFDADKRMSDPLLARGKTFVIPPKRSRKVQRDFDKDAYKARHLIENFFCKLEQYRAIHRLRQDRQKFPRRNPSRGCYHLAQLRTGPWSRL